MYKTSFGFFEGPRPSGNPIYVIWGPLGGIKGQFSGFEGLRPSRNREKMIWRKKNLRKKRFLIPNWPKMPTKWAQMGSVGGYKGPILGF